MKKTVMINEAQYKSLSYILDNLEFEGITGYKLIANGIRLKDYKGAVGDYVYDNISDSVVLHTVA